jgi:uncharacterized small protein (DUF1192 family)
MDVCKRLIRRLPIESAKRHLKEYQTEKAWTLQHPEEAVFTVEELDENIQILVDQIAVLQAG